MVLDAIVVGIPLAIANSLVVAAFGTQHLVVSATGFRTVRSLEGGASTAMLLGIAVIVGLYFAILNGTRDGQTLGNRAPGIAVRDVETGEEIGFGRGALRWVVRFALYAAFLLPGLMNDLFPLWDARNQTLADKAARSVMVRVK
jgi:serine/threonine-protein kinase